MEGQIILIGYDSEANDKLLKIEANYEGEGEGEIDEVTFPDLKVSVNRNLLLDAIQFLKAH